MKIEKKIILILFAFSMFAFTKTSVADELIRGYKYPGYIVQNNDDTLYGYIIFRDYDTNQNKCEFYNNETDKKPVKKYKPKELKAYLIGDVLYKTINYSGGLMSKPLRFLRVFIDGKITLFNFYEEGSIPYNKEREHTVVYYKWNDKKYPKPFTSEKFVFKYAKKMAAFVADDIELSAKVLNKEKGYGLVDIYNTIEEYNEWYIVNNQ